ncbi:uncharacterized protein LOC144139813 [Haemaphysalis longicornis]
MPPLPQFVFSACCFILLSQWLGPAPVAAQDSPDSMPPFPSDKDRNPDPNFCLQPVKLKFEESTRHFDFYSGEDTPKPGLLSYIFKYGKTVAALFVPAKVLGDLPALLALVVVCLILSVIVPVVGFSCVCCRPSSTSVAADSGPRGDPPNFAKRNIYSVLLVGVCALMLVAASAALITHLYVPLGVKNLIPQSRRIVNDVTLFLDKTKDEVSNLFINNYHIFEEDFYRRVDSCVLKIGEDYSGIIGGESPIESVQKAVDRIVLVDENLKKAIRVNDELSGAIRQLKSDRLDIHAAILTAVLECSKQTPHPPYCTDLNKTFDLIPSQAASPQEISVGGLSTFTARMDIVRPGELKAQLDSVSQLPLTRAGVVQTLATTAKDVKLEVEYFGTDLMDVFDSFTSADLPLPDRLVSTMEESFGPKGALPYLGLITLAGLVFTGVLFFIVFLYSSGLVSFSFGCEMCCITQEAGYRFLSCGGCLFLSIFFFAMVATTAGMVVGFTMQRCACDVLSDLSQPAVRDAVRLTLKTIRDKDLIPGSREALSHVSADTIMAILGRFSNCHRQPMSIYRLLGDGLMRNISREVGMDWRFSWLWASTRDNELTYKLASFADPKKTPLLPKDVDLLAVLEPKLSSIHALNLDTLRTDNYLYDVDNIRFNTEPFDALSQELTRIGEIAKNQASVKTTIDAALAQVSKTVADYKNTEPKKNELASVLQELNSMKVVEGKSIDSYNKEKIENWNSTNQLQPALARTLDHSALYKEQLIQSANAYTSYITERVRRDVGSCKPVHAMYSSFLKTTCLGFVAPFNSHWVCVFTYLLLGIVACVLAYRLSTLFKQAGGAKRKRGLFEVASPSSPLVSRPAEAAATQTDLPAQGGLMSPVTPSETRRPSAFVTTSPSSPLLSPPVETAATQTDLPPARVDAGPTDKKQPEMKAISFSSSSLKIEEPVAPEEKRPEMRAFSCGIDRTKPPHMAPPRTPVTPLRFFSPSEAPHPG